MKIENWPLNKLIPYARTLRKHDKVIDKLAAAIREFGFRVPILAKSDGTIIDGHYRLKAAKAAGLETVPVICTDDLTDAQIKAFRISINRMSELSEWDHDLLKLELEDIIELDYDVSLTGLEEDLIKYLLNKIDPNTGLTDPDEIPDAEAPYTTKPGDLWQLGRHRLLCGDSTRQPDVELLMDGKSAHMVFTDPPYNVDYKGGTKDALKIKNDNMKQEEFFDFLCKVFSNMKLACNPGASIYVCYSDAEAINFRSALIKTGWLVKQTIIWVKNQFVLGRQDFHHRHEPILYGWEASAGHSWYGGRNQSTIIEEMPGLEITRIDDEYFLNFTNGVMSVLLKMPDYEVISVSDDAVSSVWKINKPLKNKEHPTIKPVAIPTRCLNNSSRAGEYVLDLFLGSGTTLISCEQTGRTCFGMELDPKYADVIVNRWQNFTGRDAILSGDGRTFNQVKTEVEAQQ